MLIVYRPDTLSPHFLLGVSQYVARDSNAALQRILLHPVAHMITLVLARGGQLALIGDVRMPLQRGLDEAILCIARLVKLIVSPSIGASMQPYGGFERAASYTRRKIVHIHRDRRKVMITILDLA